ncbi:hypothetical protein JOC54_002864 [Alkalihalobacillus xiaoxiensis]|uniref:Uncharacterized protein n=1 Tax=Shouchella xiaoxiensis TaxID=766895 RepID=A0ABS2SVM1_9BACI|nr:hypothetical protein [Shouchella xiaoxiensis]MBM7839584.1 hypothetical protein [Shouchella xiaoxiensis]
MYFGSEQFCIFMKNEFDTDIDEDGVGEETVYLEKEELSFESICTLNLPNEIRVDYCSIVKDDEEWTIGVVHELTESVPLLLICEKNGDLILIKKFLR